MRKTRFLFTLLLVLVVAVGSVFAAGGGQPRAQQPTYTQTTEAILASGVLPRNETFYMGGILWSTVAHFNPYLTGVASFGLTPNDAVARQLIFETLFLFNLLDGRMYPHLADSYEWSGQTLTIRLDRNVRWWDGQPLTAADVVNSYILQRNYQKGENYFPNIAGISINASTKENIFEIFNLLMIKWYYLPTDNQEKEMISFFEKYYDKYYINYLADVFQYQKELKILYNKPRIKVIIKELVGEDNVAKIKKLFKR